MPQRLRVLFVLRSTRYIRHVEPVVQLLTERGHAVHLAFDLPIRGESSTSLHRLCARLPKVTWEAPRRKLAPEGAAEIGHQIGGWMDYFRYLTPDYEGAPTLRERAEVRVPEQIRRLGLGEPALRSRKGLDLAVSLLRAVDELLPPMPLADATVARAAPDVVVVTPLVAFGSLQYEYLKSARTRGIPTALLVASWTT